MTVPSLIWDSPDWMNDAHAWIMASFNAHRITPLGSIETIRISPWSVVLRVTTDQGNLYFKAAAPVLAYEPALTDYLAKLRPDLLPELVAVDLQRGWMLMRDSGTPLRALIKSERSLARWRDILPLYVALQKELMLRVDQLLALGVLDRRLETLPGQFEQMIADEPSLLVGQPESLTSEEYQRLKASVGDFERMCRELASFEIPPTLHHDDFHDGNLFVRDGRVRFTDWGESAVTHPFFTLVVLLRGASNSLDLVPDAPELAQVCDWYLSLWTDAVPLADLQRAGQLAQHVGLVNRALTWRRVISSLPESRKPEYAIAVPSYLQEFINTSDAGGR